MSNTDRDESVETIAEREASWRAELTPVRAMCRAGTGQSRVGLKFRPEDG